MAITDLQKDVYMGLKGEWKRAPWTVTSVIAIWMVFWAVYLFIYPTVAGTAEVGSVKEDVKNVMVQLIDREIITTRGLQCKSPSKGFFTARLQDLMRQYYDLTKTAYPLPACEDLS